ncbi:DUF2254 domain-containing protein [Roseovarius sp. SCSIO 43702]|uniref:DUF2254 domain-containing protein n=1 Tax=Roseovarius sp. SCSIO 43702 TaxID=2823043 RepID=UPI001C72E907|nr:DUF2254 domain-containing protein [Roseovarius sp. SCSIO 43702]QYX55672.1 DUF2254 domain-containing protein [Roseovarius sp. SCSIO 43702]
MGDFFRMPVAILRRYYRKLWVRVSLYALLSLIVAVIEPIIARWIDIDAAPKIESGAVMSVLSILASSMLAVSTFSLNVMVTAHRGAAQNQTPRIHRLLLEDTTTQSVLASFIGAFVYSLTTIILIQSGLYADNSTFITMCVTVLVVVLVIAAMLRWIDHLSKLGSLDDSMRNVHDLAQDGLCAFARTPALGGNPITSDTVLPETLTDVRAPGSGYMQLIDAPGLEEALSGGSCIYVTLSPGSPVLRGQPIAQVSGHVSDEDLETLARCFVIGDMRTYEQDPAFGLSVLSEISSRALSPGINDPGTAIEAVTRLESLLWEYAQETGDDDGVDYPHVFIAVPSAHDLMDAAFAGTARDGAAMIEVATHLRGALKRLAMSPDERVNEAAVAMSRLAHLHAEKALPLDAERKRLENV